MEIITGRTGTPHVYAADDAEIYRLFLGNGDFLLITGNRLSASMNGPNEVRIADGSLIMQGRLAKIRSTDGFDSLSLDIGTSGYKRADLIVAEYNQTITTREEEHEGQIVTITDKFDSVELKVVKGTPNVNQYVEPEIITGNIDTGETHQMKLWAVYLDGINFDRLVDYRNILDTTPIQTALDTATNSVSIIEAQMSALQTNLYQYAEDLRQGITSGFAGRWSSSIDLPNSATGTPTTGLEFPMGLSYEYSTSDIVNVYLNGLKLEESEVAHHVGSDISVIVITLSNDYAAFEGQVIVDVYKIAEA